MSLGRMLNAMNSRRAERDNRDALLLDFICHRTANGETSDFHAVSALRQPHGKLPHNGRRAPAFKVGDEDEEL